jgi:hypothetical protein
MKNSTHCSRLPAWERHTSLPRPETFLPRPGAEWRTQREARVFIRLSSPEGTALLSVADAGLRAFLEAASKLVAYGEEHPHLLPALNALETTRGELARPGRCDQKYLRY